MKCMCWSNVVITWSAWYEVHVMKCYYEVYVMKCMLCSVCLYRVRGDLISGYLQRDERCLPRADSGILRRTSCPRGFLNSLSHDCYAWLMGAKLIAPSLTLSVPCYFDGWGVSGGSPWYGGASEAGFLIAACVPDRCTRTTQKPHSCLLWGVLSVPRCWLEQIESLIPSNPWIHIWGSATWLNYK